MSESFLLNDIKKHEGNITHILNIKLSNQPSKEIGDKIRKRIFQIISNNPREEYIKGINVSITWMTSAKNTCAYYYSSNPIFSDITIQKHTKLLFNKIIQYIDNDFDCIFSKGITGIAFIVTKPLSKNLPII